MAMLKTKSVPGSISSTASGKANTARAMIPMANIDAAINLQIAIATSKSGLFIFASPLGSLTFAVSVDFYGSSGIRNLRII